MSEYLETLLQVLQNGMALVFLGWVVVTALVLGKRDIEDWYHRVRLDLQRLRDESRKDKDDLDHWRGLALQATRLLDIQDEPVRPRRRRRKAAHRLSQGRTRPTGQEWVHKTSGPIRAPESNRRGERS